MSEPVLFTSESVTEGHPDKVCDIVSDSVLDAVLAADSNGRVACETAVKTGFVLIAGEITTTAQLDLPAVVRQAVLEIGYDDSDKGFDGNTCAVMVAVERQSPDIALGVDEGRGLHKEMGAGDQGMMFGYAVDETPELMPASITWAHALTRRLAEVRKHDVLPWLRPDGKSQVTVEYDGSKIARVSAVVVSTQHSDAVDHRNLREALIEHVVRPSLPEDMIDGDTVFHVNPTGRFVEGGPKADAGLTGRKIIVDTYGGHGAHGGGAFSGKDPTKVDRSAAYMARHIAKNLVAAGLASRCLVQLAYAIGVADPVSVHIDTYGTGQVDPGRLVTAVREIFPLKPAGIIEHFGLRSPIFRPTAAYGHFGRSEFPWESVAHVADLRSLVGS
jgi:S-adenosylmethionine synthetase